jgi:RHS repeat-associated protein
MNSCLIRQKPVKNGLKSTANRLLVGFGYIRRRFSTGSEVSYYYTGSTRIAQRRVGYGSNNGLFWLTGDHLGSTSVTANSSGTKTAEVRYKPWGEDRFTSGTTLTTFKYTGQREESSFRLYYYGARWYDSSLGRFTSADTVTTGGTQGWDRYAAMANNSVRFTDPSGHAICDEEGKCYEHGQQVAGQRGGFSQSNNPLDPAHEFLNNMRVPTNGGSVVTKFGAFNTCESLSDGATASVKDYQDWGAHAAVDIADPDTDDIYAAYGGKIVGAANTGTNA